MVMDFFLGGSWVFELSHRWLRVGQVATGPVLGPHGGDQRRKGVEAQHHHDRDGTSGYGGYPRGDDDRSDAGGDHGGDLSDDGGEGVAVAGSEDLGGRA